MNFDPIELPADLHPSSLSVTLLGRQNVCPRSALLALSSSGGAGSHEMIRGTAVHTAVERCIQDMLLVAGSSQDASGSDFTPSKADVMEQAGRRIAPDLAREIANEVISEGVLLGRETDPHPGRVPVPFEEHDFIRLCLFRWSDGFELPADQDAVLGVEQMFELDVAGWTVRGKLDLAYRDGPALHVKDWKSSRAMPSNDEVSVVRSDGRTMPKTFPLILYALLARYGHPVEWMVCGACEGPTVDPHAIGCETCEGKGGGWRRLAQWPVFDEYRLSLVYPAIEVDGLAERGPMVLEERDLHDFRRALTGHVELFDSRLHSDDWPALPGSHCSECNAPAECPLPAHLRDFEGAFETLEMAESAAQALYVAKKHAQTVQTALRNAAKSNGWDVIRCGSDRAFSFDTKVSHSTDWPALEADRRTGNVRDISEYRTRKESTEFKDRKYSEEAG